MLLTKKSKNAPKKLNLQETGQRGETYQDKCSLQESSHIRADGVFPDASRTEKWQESLEAGAGFAFKNGHAAFPTQAIEWDGRNYPPAGDCDPPLS